VVRSDHFFAGRRINQERLMARGHADDERVEFPAVELDSKRAGRRGLDMIATTVRMINRRSIQKFWRSM
jgi:hypothetical protein